MRATWEAVTAMQRRVMVFQMEANVPRSQMVGFEACFGSVYTIEGRDSLSKRCLAPKTQQCLPYEDPIDRHKSRGSWSPVCGSGMH